MWLVCSQRCGGTLFRALNAEVEVDAAGTYQAHDVPQPERQRAVHSDLAVGQGVLQELQALVEGPHAGPLHAAPSSHHVPNTSTRPSLRTLTLTNGRAGSG